MGRTTDAKAIIKATTGIDIDADPEVQDYLREFAIGQMIHDARTAAGMTQQQLADLVGTKQPVISQLEDANYEGHSLTMLDRIASAKPARGDSLRAPGVRTRCWIRNAVMHCLGLHPGSRTLNPRKPTASPSRCSPANDRTLFRERYRFRRLMEGERAPCPRLCGKR